MTHWMRQYIVLAIVLSGPLAEAACTISPLPTTGLVAGLPSNITVTNDGSCTGSTIGIYFSLSPNSGPAIPSEVYTLSAEASQRIGVVEPSWTATTRHVLAIKPPGSSIASVLSNSYVVAQNASRIYCGGLSTDGCNPNVKDRRTGVAYSLLWFLPTTSHPGAFLSVGLTRAGPTGFDAMVPLPDGVSSGTVSLKIPQMGWPMAYRLVRGGVVEFQSQPFIVTEGTTPPPPPPPIRCTVTVLSGNPIPGSTVTGTVVGCP